MASESTYVKAEKGKIFEGKVRDGVVKYLNISATTESG